MTVSELASLAQPSIKAALKRVVYGLVELNATAEARLNIYLSRRVYRRTFGRDPDLANPTLFSEKVVARKLFDQRPIFRLLADKLRAREFAAERIGREFLPELYFVGRRFEDIDFGRLPDKFVIKTNHGSGWCLIVEDKKTFDWVMARKMLRRWLQASYYFASREIFYKNIEPNILIEEYLQESSGAPATDYRFYVYDGVVKFIQIRAGVINSHFDRQLRPMPVKLWAPGSSLNLTESFRQDYLRRNPLLTFAFPPNMPELYEIAARLGHGFDFIRVDLYNPGGRILFGEMTSLPGGGARSYDPPVYDQILGEDWHLVLGDPPG